MGRPLCHNSHLSGNHLIRELARISCLLLRVRRPMAESVQKYRKLLALFSVIFTRKTVWAPFEELAMKGVE